MRISSTDIILIAALFWYLDTLSEVLLMIFIPNRYKFVTLKLCGKYVEHNIKYYTM